jgi:hypothetical protein
LQTVEIRLQLLKDVGAGLSKRETIKHLSEKFHITESAGYYHFASKNKWLDSYLNFDKDALFEVKTRFNYIYREASFQYLHAQNDNARIGYLRTMLEAASKLKEFLPDDVSPDKPNGYILRWHKSEPQIDLSKLTAEEKEIVDEAARIYIKLRNGNVAKASIH